MERSHPLGDLMGTTMEKLHEMVDANTVVGEPIVAGEVTLIPISKLSFGFTSGGGDFIGKHHKPQDTSSFAGGSGAGVNITPVAFLVVKGDVVRLLPVAQTGGVAERVVDMVPELVEKVTGFIEKQQKNKEPTF